MSKYVLFLLAGCFILLGILLIPAAAEDYTNDTWIQKKSDKYLSGESYSVPVGDEYLYLFGKGAQDSLDIDNVTVGIRPRTKIPLTATVVKDSIDSQNSRAVRQTLIPGLQVEKYYFIPFSEYAKKNLDASLESTWSNNSQRMTEWSSEKKSGGITDLDFSLPVGKRFEQLLGGKTRLNINGSQTITFSGKSEYDEGEISTSVSKNSSFPSLTMKQEPQFSIQGMVGDRIEIDIKQDSQGDDFSIGKNLEDNIHIRYKGDDNDIIQSIEAGNTSLNLEGATFAGYQGSHKGLFGIRSEGRIGPIKFTAIASQEKSEANTKSFRGSAEEATTQIRDYSYKSNTYFFLDNRYKDVFAENRTSLDLIYYNPADSIVKIEVYEDDGIQSNDTSEGTIALPGIALPMNMDTNIPVKSEGITGFFHHLTPTKDYSVDRRLGFIVFREKVQDTATIGIYMETKSGNKYGNLDYQSNVSGSKIELKLIKPKSQRPTDTDTWDLEWKNVYDIGQTNIDPEGLEISIFRDVSDGTAKETQNGIPYIQILGLDKTDEQGNLAPDNKVDLNRSVVDTYRGEIIFPLLHPFDSEPPAGVSVELDPKIPAIYETQNQQEKVEASKYYIEVKTANSVQSYTIGSGGLGGIAEDSERVTVDGKTLTRGKDYTINYQSGKLTFTNQDAIGPNSVIQATYEEVNAIQPMQKSLFGIRSDYEFLGNSRIGGVILYNNESTSDQRVKLGQEPSRTLLFDTDTNINFESKFLTRMVDMIPGITTDQKSSVRFEGELARSIPNMNTKGVVYIDDFEGSQNTPLGIVRTNWTTSSIPDSKTTGGITLQRGKLWWYNPWDRVDSRAVWPNKETASGENTVYVLNLDYSKKVGIPDDQSFGGVMNAFYGTGLDMSHSRFLEVWAKGNKGDLKIDLGSISEEYFPLDNPNDLLDTEDQPISGMGHGDGILTTEEDTGLDGVFDKAEPGYSAQNPDPVKDNWSYSNKEDYSNINGTEGNRFDSDRAGLPDTEDINSNGVLDTKNKYYEYTISLNNPFDPYLVQDSVPTGNPGGWRLFRIPLWNNPSAVVGGSEPPDSTLIEFSRLWVTNTDSTLIQIASMEIVESNWLESGIFDKENTDVSQSSFDRVRVTRVNTDENLDYASPPGVSAEIDRTTKVRQMEQSLVVDYEQLHPGNTAFIYRNFEKMDFTDYTALKMYVHGPDDFPDPSAETSEVELILRFGADENNYYEYRTPIFKGWAAKNFVEADFARCTAVKLDADSIDVVDGNIYTFNGSPSLSNVKIISIGIQNNKPDLSMTGKVWVDELRMDSLREMTGTAARFSINTDLAGFASITTKASKRSSDFHDMNSDKGSGSDNTSWDSSIAVNLDRFAPTRWKLNLPVTANISKTEQSPRLLPGSDIIIDPAQKLDYLATTSSKTVHLTYGKGKDTSRKGGIRSILINWGFEKVNLNFDWGEQTSNNPTSGSMLDTSKQAKATYNVDPTVRSFKPFLWMKKWKSDTGKKMSDLNFTYIPNQMVYDVVYDDDKRIQKNTENVSDTTSVRTLKESYTFGYSPLTAVKYDFHRNQTTDLYLKMVTNFAETNNITLSGPKFNYLTNNYTYSATYTEKNNPRYSLSSQMGGMQVDFRKSFSVNASLAWEKMFEDLSGKGGPPKSESLDQRAATKNIKDIKALDPKKAENKQKKEEVSKHPKGQSLRSFVFLSISKAVSPLTITYRKDEQLNYYGVSERPGFMTRFGQGTISSSDSSTVSARQNSSGGSEDYSMNTIMRLPMDIEVSASMKKTLQTNLSSSANTKSDQSVFPDIDFQWNSLEKKIPLLKSYAHNISIKSGYSITTQTEWLDEGVNPNSDRTEHSFSPLVSVNAIFLGNLQGSLSLSKSSETSHALSGETITSSIYDKNDITASFTYRMSPTTGIFRKLKLKSNIDLSLNLTKSGSQRMRNVESNSMAVTEKNDSWSVSPKADYRFSEKFTGGATMNFQNSKDLTNRVHVVREVSIWGKLVF
ncbi:MAG: cell surface protein SprA [Candidatus Latescibacterota bacterium]